MGRETAPSYMNFMVMPSLGDAIYCRPFVKRFASSIVTKWPDLFSDFVPAAQSGKTVTPKYNSKSLVFHNIPRAIGRFFPNLDDLRIDLPDGVKPIYDKYAVIRPPTLREDFYGPARNPNSTYIAEASDILRSRGYITIGIARIDHNEQFDGTPPKVDIAYWNGLPIPELMGLLQHADIIVAGPGFTVPSAIAYSVPHVIVYGGAAKWNKPEKLIDISMKHKITWVMPDNFCHECKSITHNCNKTITDFGRKFEYAIDNAMHM